MRLNECSSSLLCLVVRAQYIHVLLTGKAGEQGEKKKKGGKR